MQKGAKVANLLDVELIIPINQETLWTKDFSGLLRDHGMRENLKILI